MHSNSRSNATGTEFNSGTLSYVCHNCMEWEKANDIAIVIKALVKRLGFDHVQTKQIVCFRSYGSSSRARARIWSFPRVWQLALDLPPHYVIEVLSEKFDKLSENDKTKVLIHELLHIPKTFSGALVPHRGRHHRIDSRRVEKLFKQYKKTNSKNYKL